MPALVKRSPGESGRRDDDGTIVWPCEAKKSRKDWRISAEVMRKRKGESKEADAAGAKDIFMRCEPGAAVRKN
jgi:hypothetical protein